MATVDGAVVAPDAYGIIQGNGGDSDRIAGGAGNDKLQGHAAFNQYYGGAGNDTFILMNKWAVASGAHEGQSTVFTDQFAYITDFQGAGEVGGDFISLSGFQAGTLQLERVGVSGTSGAMLYYYSVQNAEGQTYNFLVNSLTGKELGAGDFNFY